MILGVGIDVVETHRVARAVTRYGPRFERRVYTPQETAACSARADRIPALAARLAAKEAFLKALGTGWVRGLSLRQVEVVRSNGGPPELHLSAGAAEQVRQRGVTRLHLSLTHERDYAAAVVVLEG